MYLYYSGIIYSILFKRPEWLVCVLNSWHIWMYAMWGSISAMSTEFNVFVICWGHMDLAGYNLCHVIGVWTSQLCHGTITQCSWCWAALCSPSFPWLFPSCLLVFNDPDEECLVYAPINLQMSNYLVCAHGGPYAFIMVSLPCKPAHSTLIVGVKAYGPVHGPHRYIVYM